MRPGVDVHTHAGVMLGDAGGGGRAVRREQEEGRQGVRGEPGDAAVVVSEAGRASLVEKGREGGRDANPRDDEEDRAQGGEQLLMKLGWIEMIRGSRKN